MMYQAKENVLMVCIKVMVLIVPPHFVAVLVVTPLMEVA